MTFEEMYEKCGEIYYRDYADGEYCHEQSFRWGFQEAWDFFTQQLIDEEKLDELAKEYAKNELKHSFNINDIHTQCCISDFKAGYRKAKEK